MSVNEIFSLISKSWKCNYDFKYKWDKNYIMRIVHNYPKNAIFLDDNLKLHKMIKMHSKYDNMRTSIIFNALNCINNHVNSYITCMLTLLLSSFLCVWWRNCPSLHSSFPLSLLSLSNSDIGLSTNLGHLLFTLNIKTYGLSFGYVILGFSSSHRQHAIRAITPFTAIVIVWHCCRHSQCAASSQISALSSWSSSLAVVVIKPLCRSDDTSIHVTKTYLQKHLSIRDFGSLRYFVGITLTHQDGKLALALASGGRTSWVEARDFTHGSSPAVLGYFVSTPWVR